jgi:hypothetical protein
VKERRREGEKGRRREGERQGVVEDRVRGASGAGGARKRGGKEITPGKRRGGKDGREWPGLGM